MWFKNIFVCGVKQHISTDKYIRICEGGREVLVKGGDISVYICICLRVGWGCPTMW